MTHTNDKLKVFIRKEFPWGTRLAKRSTFEMGFASEEGRLVAKYLKPSSDVLIIGSGNGREARPICCYGHRIVCMDIVPIYLRSGDNLFIREGIQNVHFLQADMAQLPFRKESFDFIFFSLYTYASERRFDIIGGIREILRPKGFVLFGANTSITKNLCPEIFSCGFELLKSVRVPDRPEYRFSILRKQNAKDDGRRGI